MQNINTCPTLSRHDSSARDAILMHYKMLGETASAIKKIQLEINTLAKKHYKLDSILPDYLQIIRQVEASRCHKIIRLKQHKKFQVAIHIIPSMNKIPAHVHPGLISIINVQYGELHVEQLSLSNSQKKYYSKIREQQTCAGLFNLRNIHHIQTLAVPCVLLSFRVARKHSHSLKKKLFLLLTSSALFLFPQAITHKLSAGDNDLAYSSNHLFNNQHPRIKSHRLNNPLILANKLRNGIGIKQDLYSASQIYLQEAIKGNAEAQYCLGVMILDGSGITEDYDEALHWIATSSDQEYLPAQKLLHYLLATDDISDC